MSTLASLHESIMLKQSPSRNQRSKEFKVKHALQICLLLAICIWLLYQAKQTCNKKLALEESSGTAKLSYGNGIFKLGRKGLDPQLEEIVTDIRKTVDDDKGQQDKLGESEGNKTGDGNDEIVGQDQEKGEEEEEEEEEPEQLEDLIDEDDNEGKGSVEIDSESEDVDLIT